MGDSLKKLAHFSYHDNCDTASSQSAAIDRRIMLKARAAYGNPSLEEMRIRNMWCFAYLIKVPFRWFNVLVSMLTPPKYLEASFVQSDQLHGWKLSKARISI